MSEHTKAWEQIPWLVNGSLRGDALAKLQRHLATCSVCRAEVALQSLFRSGVAAQPTVEFAPQASFNKLWERIETDAQLQPASDPTPRRERRWFMYAIAAQWLLVAGLAWWYVSATEPAYQTVTSQSAAPSGELKVVFDADTTLSEINEILADNNLKSISGPTPAGVFVLSRDAQSQNLDLVLAQLRADPHVRFAESSASE